jgi:hypothetical protein
MNAVAAAMTPSNIAIFFMIFEFAGFATFGYSCRKHFATKGRKRVRPSSSGISRRRPLRRKSSQLVRSYRYRWNPRHSDLPLCAVTNH